MTTAARGLGANGPGAGSSAGAGDSKAERLAANLRRMEELAQRLSAALARRRQSDPALSGPSSEVYMKAAAAYLAEIMQNPAKILEHQIAWWGKTLTHYVDAQQALARGELSVPSDATGTDRRFANPLWGSHPFFNFVKQQYFLNADAVTTALSDISLNDPVDRRRVDYFIRQIIDMFSPTNFLATNPDALEKAVATDGESLVRGLENLVRDIEANEGELLVTLADPNAFVVGQNIGTAQGSVVYRNRMIELIQYSPTTPQVHEVPLLIFPPWINKFYILDLKPQNSLIRWIVDQGYTLFVVSWVNPDASYADTGLDDYIRDGYLRAIAEVRRLTGAAEVNATGYCIAGTTLALTLAHLQKAGDTSVKSASFFTTLTDFSDQGEFSVFLTDDFVDGIERQVAQDGVLSRLFMSRTFSFLRANDLIYQPAIRSYMLGEQPPAFDLLFWNGDATDLPGRMAMDYLRGLCQRNEFAEGRFPVFGQPVSLGDIKLPVCAIACENDHIAAWKASFNGIRQFGSAEKTFILSESGHVAGVVNPPSRNKYGHWTEAPVEGSAEGWKLEAQFHPGSWWPSWGAWLAARSGGMVEARIPGAGGGEILGPAPGTYVLPVAGAAVPAESGTVAPEAPASEAKAEAPAAARSSAQKLAEAKAPRKPRAARVGRSPVLGAEAPAAAAGKAEEVKPPAKPARAPRKARAALGGADAGIAEAVTPPPASPPEAIKPQRKPRAARAGLGPVKGTETPATPIDPAPAPEPAASEPAAAKLPRAPRKARAALSAEGAGATLAEAVAAPAAAQSEVAKPARVPRKARAALSAEGAGATLSEPVATPAAAQPEVSKPARKPRAARVAKAVGAAAAASPAVPEPAVPSATPARGRRGRSAKPAS